MIVINTPAFGFINFEAAHLCVKADKHSRKVKRAAAPPRSRAAGYSEYKTAAW